MHDVQRDETLRLSFLVLCISADAQMMTERGGACRTGAVGGGGVLHGTMMSCQQGAHSQTKQPLYTHFSGFNLNFSDHVKKTQTSCFSL